MITSDVHLIKNSTVFLFCIKVYYYWFMRDGGTCTAPCELQESIMDIPCQGFICIEASRVCFAPNRFYFPPPPPNFTENFTKHYANFINKLLL